MNMFFDLSVSADITVTALGLNLVDGGTVGGSQNLIGGSAPIQFWITPLTWVGNANTQANWALLGTGTVTVADVGQRSPVVLSAPFSLTAGVYGCAITYLPMTNGAGTSTGTATGPLHPEYTGTAAAPPNPTVYSDQYLTYTAGATQPSAWLSGATNIRVCNFDMNYQPSINVGYSSSFGSGCYNRPSQSWYQYDLGGTNRITWPLSNSGITMLYNGPNYTVLQGSSTAYTTPTSTPLALLSGTLDNGYTAPQTLPWSFPYPGGSTAQVWMNTNGSVFLSASPGSSASTNFSNVFFSGATRLAPAWGDWDLSAQGSMHFDVDPSNQFVTLSWNNVQELNDPTSSNSFQARLFASGQVEFIWGNVAHRTPPLVVGFGRGFNDPNPSSIDIATSMPFQSGDGQRPPVLGLTTRPVIGTTINLTTTNISASTVFGLVALSFLAPPPSPFNELSAFGMPDCFQNVGLPATTAFLFASGGAMTLPLSIPNQASFNGVNMLAQSAPLTPGLNPAGIVTSNGLCVHIGIQ
jgi:hypothetical protein